MSLYGIYDLIIIGAGMSGISAGRYLSSNTVKVKILDKGIAPGGRMATKRIDYQGQKAIFDYGCKYITALNSEFSVELISLDSANPFLKTWSVYKINNDRGSTDKSKKLIGKNSMRDIALTMSRNLDITTETRVSAIKWINDHWEIFSDNGVKYDSKYIMLTMPVPQIIDLLVSSKITVPKTVMHDLENVEYNSSIVGMFLLNSNSNLHNQGGLKLDSYGVSFITDNNLKGINFHKTAVSVEMSDKFSRDNWNLRDSKIANKMIELADNYFGSEVIDYRIHRWKFSVPSESYPKKYEYFMNPGPLFMAGDAFSGNSVESAFTSGISAAKKLDYIIKKNNKVLVK